MKGPVQPHVVRVSETFACGGKGEIRTLEGLHPARFRDEDVQPLRHLPGGFKKRMTLGIIHFFELVTLARLERATSSSAGKRSNPLSYRVATKVNIAPSRTKCKCVRKFGRVAPKITHTISADARCNQFVGCKGWALQSFVLVFDSDTP